MNNYEIQEKLKTIVEQPEPAEFVFELLLAYGISKTSITRLKKGDYNLAKTDGELLYKKKIFFKTTSPSELLAGLAAIEQSPATAKHQPRFAVVTDHTQLLAKDLKSGRSIDIPMVDLPQYFDFFLPLAGSEIYNASNNNEADRNASYKMAQLYDVLTQQNPHIYEDKTSIHELNVFLSRLLFCFFAEDTGIFEDNIFTNSLAQQTAYDGSDTQRFLNELFLRLNTEDGANFPQFLRQFPYVNGGLFAQNIASPIFNAKARKLLIDLGDLDWKDINPDIFGSMIQAVVTPDYRSDLGMHYTSVENIQKLIKPLFLDALYQAYAQAKTQAQLQQLQARLGKIKFFDPACGSGNFLIITYKEIRFLEILILEKITELEGQGPSIKWTEVQLSQFYGIEIDDFAHEMAILSLWLAEHQMNKIFEERLQEFGLSKPILPLKEAGQISQGNATRVDWQVACPCHADDEVYVIGNPPYLGSRNQDQNQKEDMAFVFTKDYKSMDYVSIWFYKGAKYIEHKNAKCAFVSTNSVCQGLLVGLTWPRVLNENIEIDFAYQSFKWVNNAKGNAGVTVIIVGLRNTSTNPKFLFKNNTVQQVKNINAYLLDSGNVIVRELMKPISANFPKMNFGNMPADGGHLLFTEEEKKQFLLKEPAAKKWIRELISAHEFLNGKKRFCLWLEDISDEELEALPSIKERVDKVYKERINSSRPQLAQNPHLFAQITQPADSEFISIPRVSSESRNYIPIGYFSSDYKSSDSTLTISDAEPWLFGVLHAKMHMIWVDAVGGKLETRYRYSAKLCYNTFPFPTLNAVDKERLKLHVYAIIDARSQHPEKTMAWLYDPLTMPPGLLAAHQALDAAIERCYRPSPFENDTQRLEYLFALYEEMLG